MTVLALVPIGSPVLAKQREPFIDSGSCEQLAVFVQTRAENVAAYVPDSFEIAGEQETGFANVLVGVGTCDPHPTQFGIVAVTVNPPDGSTAIEHLYDIWWFFDDPEAHSRYRTFDITSHNVRPIEFATIRASGALVGAEGSVRWTQSPFEASVIGPAPPIQTVISSVHWHLGDHGRVRTTTQHPTEEIGVVTGMVRTPPGSPLARILGGPTAVGPALLGNFGFTSVTELA
jgi:hypothetical protein